MSTYRDMTILDTLTFNYVNLDQLTETYSTSFYGEYVTHWPEYQRIALHPTTQLPIAYMLAKAEGDGEDYHGHVSAVTVAPTFRRLGIAEALMREMEQTTMHVHNAYFVDLFVRDSNTVAQDMYHKLGYIVYRRVLGYYGKSSTSSSSSSSSKGGANSSEDALDMRKAMPRDKTQRRSSVIPLTKPVTPAMLEWS